MPTRVAQSDPNPSTISTDTSQPLDARAQNAALATYNTAIGQLNDAQAKLDQMQNSARPANSVAGSAAQTDANGNPGYSGQQWDKDYADASAAVAAAKTQAAQAARQYATILQDQAKTAATDTSPAGQAKAAQAQAQADYVQAKADGYAAKTQADIEAARTRADAARTRANALLNKADTYQSADGLYIRDPVTGLYSKAVDSSGNAIPGTTSAASTAETTARTALTQAQTDLANATLPAEKASAQLKVDQAQQALDQAKALAPGAVAQQGASTAQTAAQTALTNAQTALANATLPAEKAAAQLRVDQAQQALDAAKAQAPATLAGTEATTAGTQANTAAVQQQTAQRNAPTVVGSPAATDRVITTRDPNTGALTTQPNPNTTDIAAQVQQINQAAHTFRDNLQTQVLNGQLDPDEALQKFHDYWSATVEPQRQALVDAQQKAQFNQGLQARTQASVEEQNRAAGSLSTQQAGETAGNDAVKRAMDMLPLQVGPQYGQHMAEAINGLATGHPTSNFTSADFTSTAPDMNAIHHQAVAEALKGISPYAASQIGAPMPSIPQGVDVNGLLNQSQYGGSFSTAPSAPAASSNSATAGDPASVAAAAAHGAVSAALGNPLATPATPITQPIPAYMPRAGNLDSVPSPTY